MTTKPRLLLVEDDARIVSFLRRGLEGEGYDVTVANDGDDGLKLARTGDFDVVILDRMLPSLSGLDICRALRAEESRALILMLTAMDALQDKIEGLKGGADDYVTKPFSFEEVLARLEALQRRQQSSEAPPVIEVGDLRLDHATKTVTRGDRRISLTAKEFALLEYLMRNAGAVVSRERLLADVWRLKFDPGTNVVDVYVRYLRRKIDEEEEKPLIQTVRGFGYTLSAE